MSLSETNTQDKLREISLLDALNDEWLKLPFPIMQDCGPAVQTLAGLLRITNRETLVPATEIANRARLPVGTARKHMVTLHTHRWIVNAGREAIRAGFQRRTATIQVTSQTREAIASYGVLPWWACCSVGRFGRLRWSSRAVLAVIMARLMSLVAAAEGQKGPGLDADDLIRSIESMGGEDRFQFSLSYLQTQTGLSRESVVEAKRQLSRAKIIGWYSREAEHGGQDRHTLAPNWRFRVVQTPASSGGVWLDFRG